MCDQIPACFWQGHSEAGSTRSRYCWLLFLLLPTWTTSFPKTWRYSESGDAQRKVLGFSFFTTFSIPKIKVGHKIQWIFFFLIKNDLWLSTVIVMKPNSYLIPCPSGDTAANWGLAQHQQVAIASQLNQSNSPQLQEGLTALLPFTPPADFLTC